MTLAAPVLIDQGALDVIRETNAALATRFRNARNVRIPDASHFPWVEQPDRFADAVLAVLP
jgi:pimeloyl-ACP methyl ester carboxylesterase